jgi:uncharacterized membrane protein YoaK (UPF0700 family)
LDNTLQNYLIVDTSREAQDAPRSMRALHGPDSVFSLRHLPSWLILAFSAGAVNVIAFLACSRFVTHVTGTVSSIGMGIGAWRLAVDYAVVLGCFVVGAMTSSALIDGQHLQDKKPYYALPLLAAALALAAVAVAGSLGLFGDFGGAVEGARDFAFLSILAFAMGLQNAAVATSTGLVVRTTHMTGPATDLGIHLTTALYAAGDVRRMALRHAMLRSGKIASFALGGAVGAALARTFGFGALLLPVLGILAATALSFVSAPLVTGQQEATR